MQIGLGTLLFIVFLVLKLTGVITWAWIWVTAPLWIGLIISVVILLVLLIMKIIVAMVDN